MFVKLLKIVGAAVLGVCVLTLVIVATVFVKPSLLLSAANQWTNYQVTATDIQLRLAPLEIELQELDVKFDDQALVRTDRLNASFDWTGSLQMASLT